MQKLELKSIKNGLYEEFQTASESANRTKNRYANVLPRKKILSHKNLKKI